MPCLHTSDKIPQGAVPEPVDGVVPGSAGKVPTLQTVGSIMKLVVSQRRDERRPQGKPGRNINPHGAAYEDQQ